MAHGLAVLTSDGWAIEEYVRNRETGVVVQGRARKVSWIDEKTGILRENYSPMYTRDEAVITQLAAALGELADDARFRLELAARAQEAVRTEFTVERWNNALREVFERI
jgi:hypothetical protein